MTALYQIENSNPILKLQEMMDYISNDALHQQLHEVEGNLFKNLLQLGKILLKNFIENKGTGNKDLLKNIELPLHSIKPSKYLSIFGDIAISRAYFWKKGKLGEFPLDKELNLPKRHQSYLLDKWIQGGVAEGPYEDAINNIGDLLDLKLTKKVSQNVTLEASKEVHRYYAQKTNFDNEGSHLVVQCDCKGVIMIPKERPEQLREGFIRRAKGVSKIGIRKDAVVTTDYSINPISRDIQDVLDGLMNINSNKKKEKKRLPKKDNKPINKQVSGNMDGKENAFKNLADRIYIRDKTEQKKIYILIDGASSLETGFIKEFKKRGWESRVEAYCLDIVHATEYLWDASTALYGETNPRRISWVRSSLLKLLQGKTLEVNNELARKISSGRYSDFIVRRLQRSLTYFTNHIHMMDYKKYLDAGFPIASGAIEGACNTLVKDRTDRSGMQWTKIGAQAVINLRSAKCNDDWESYWNYYIQNQFKELYENNSLAA
jgi:hypothetical protein